MNVILIAIVAAVLVGLASAGVLISTQKYAYEAYSTSGARVSDPGHNLVGPKWTGEGEQKRS